MSRNMALHRRHIITKVIVARVACLETWPRDTRIERSSMSHMDDVIGMMAYLEQHTDGRDDRGRNGVQGSCNHSK